MGLIYWTDSLVNGDNVTQTHITNLKNDITAIVNGGLTNSNINASAAIVESKLAFNTTTGHDHDGTDSKLISPAADMIVRGFEIGNAVADDLVITVQSGVAFHGSTIITKTANTTLTFADAASWWDGATDSYAGGAGWCYVGYDVSGNIKLLGANAPDKADASGNTDGTKFYWYDTALYWRVIGAIRVDTDNKVHVIGHRQSGNYVMLDVPIQITSTASYNAWSSAVSCVTGMPAISVRALFRMHITGSAGDTRDNGSIRPNGSTWDNPGDYATGHGDVGMSYVAVVGQIDSFTDSSQQIQHYEWSGGSAGTIKINLLGYYLNIR